MRISNIYFPRPFIFIIKKIKRYYGGFRLLFFIYNVNLYLHDGIIKVKIQNKLFLVLFSFSSLLVTALVLLIQWSIGRGMVEYVNSKETEALQPLVLQLASEYQQQNGWDSMQGEHEKLIDLLFITLKDTAFIPGDPREEFRSPPRKDFRSPPRESGKSHRPNDYREPYRETKSSTEQMSPRKSSPGPSMSPRAHQPSDDLPGYALFDDKENLIAGYYDKNFEYSKTAVIVDFVDVGWLLTPKLDQLTDGYELDFIKQQQSYLWIIAFVTMGLVVLITLPLTRHLVGPIKKLTQGMHHLTQGNYQQKVEQQRQDELGELSRDFNELAITLDKNENARKRWLANISHELRTPVAILRGELEAMLDGVRPINQSNIDSANDEVKHLQHLVDDLQLLTSADIGGMHYRKKAINFSLWLNSEIKKYYGYLQDANIRLEVEIEETEITTFADTTRLCQLFHNLINNCIKYSQAGLVKISVKINLSAIPLAVITVEDDGIGVEQKHLENLFEYLYRVDNSRNRKTGGSGLGLSICAHIVSAHQGNISAHRSDLGGLAVVTELPLSK